MSQVLFYFILIVFGLITPLFLALCSIFFLLTAFLGAPFVGTKTKSIDQILNKVKVKPTDVFLDLGSGDGRLVMAVARRYGIKAIGVEINPILVLYSKLVAKITRRHTAHFVIGNIYTYPLNQATIIFTFLPPTTLVKMKNRYKSTCPSGTRIISHGFTIPGWDNYLQSTVKDTQFNTYIYQVG